MKKQKLFVCFLGVLLLFGCQSDVGSISQGVQTGTGDYDIATFIANREENSNDTGTQQHDLNATQTYQAKFPLTPSPTATDSGIRNLETEPLDSKGPWLAIKDNAGLWIMNHDGKGNKIQIPDVRELLVSPDGHKLAYLVRGEDGDPDLKVLLLPENRIILSMDIFNFKLEDFNVETHDNILNYQEDLLYAVGRLAWSPDSSMLAFTSSHESSTSDLYLYDTLSNDVTRLTTGSTQAVDPIWSPDGRYIFHAGVERLYIGYNGAGYRGWKLYSVTPDGRNIYLYNGIDDNTGFEDVLGWLSDRYILMNSGHWWCGYFNLRMMNIETGKTLTFWRGKHDSAAFSSDYASILVGSSQFKENDEDCGPEEESGLFLISTADNYRTRLLDDKGWYEITWSDEGHRFIVDSENLGIFTVDGTGSIERWGGEPIFAPGGEYWLVKDDGLFNDLGFVKDFYIDRYSEAFWSPDGQSIYIEDEGALFRASAPDFEQELISTLFSDIQDYVWIIPNFEGVD